MTIKHNPGSPEAIEQGCTCSPEINANGVGYYGLAGHFCYTQGCSYHPVSEMTGTHMLRRAEDTYVPTVGEIEEAKRFFLENP